MFSGFYPTKAPKRIPANPIAHQTERQFFLLAVALLAQFGSFLATWPLWTQRDEPVALPWIAPSVWDAGLESLPDSTIGVLLLVSLSLCLPFPRWGGWVQGLLLLLACVADQYRFQPQFLFLSVCILAFSRPFPVPMVRWLFISLWIWAGVHKLLSPEWFGIRSFSLFSAWSPIAAHWHYLGAWGIAILEVLLGSLAIVRPRWAATGCVLLHVGIAVFLSPLGINYNTGVIPWNLFLAVAGFVVFYFPARPEPVKTATLAGWAIPVGLLLYPAGFYPGWIDHNLAFSLYSGLVPEGRITQPSREEQTPMPSDSIHGVVRAPKRWGVPFPYEQSSLLRYFERNASPGAKLHIHDPRPWLRDRFYLKTTSGSELISIERFLKSSGSEPRGEFHHDLADSFRLIAKKHQLYRRWVGGPVYAIQFNPSTFRPRDLEWLRGLPGLEQIQLKNCSIQSEDLLRIPKLLNLQVIDLQGTPLTTKSLVHLQAFPRLKEVAATPDRIPPEELIEYGFEPLE